MDYTKAETAKGQKGQFTKEPVLSRKCAGDYLSLLVQVFSNFGCKLKTLCKQRDISP